MISNPLVAPSEQDDLSFSSIHRDPDTSIPHPAYSSPSSSSSLDPSSFFLPPDPASSTTTTTTLIDDDESHPDHQHFLSSSEMTSSQPWSSFSASTEAKPSSLISSATSTSDRRQNGAQANSPSSHSFASSSTSSSQPYRPHLQQQQGAARYNNQGPSSYRPNRQYPPYRLPSPSGRPFPPSSANFPLQPSSFIPHLRSSPSSPSGPNYGYAGGLPGIEGGGVGGGGGGGAGREGGEGGRAWSPFPAPGGGAPPSPFPPTYGLPHQGEGYYPPGSSSSAASSPGGYQTSNSFDPRGPSPTPSSLDASPNRSSSTASSSNRYRHQPAPPQQGYGSNHHQILRPPFSSYQHRSPGLPPPPSSFYQPNLYQSPPPPSSMPGGLSHPNAMQPHTVQGPDGQTWMYFPIPVASGYYGGQPLPFQDNSPGGGGGPSFPGGMGGGPYGPYGSGSYHPYGAGGGGGGGPSSASSPHLGPLPSSPSPLNANGPSPFPPPFPLATLSPLPPQGMGFNPLSPSSRPIPTGPSSSISPRSNLSHSHSSSSSSNLVRKPYHPPSPAARSEWVMWCGNVPSDASQDELDAFFNSQSLIPNSISSIFNISRSQCCFVNFTSQEALESGIATFNGMAIRPDEGVRSARLVCRVRRKEDDLKAGVGGQRGRGVHTGWVREKQQQQQVMNNRERENKEVGEEVAGIAAEASATSGVGGNGNVGPATTMMRSRTHHQGSTGSVRTISSQASTDSSFLAKNFPVRYFIMKSLTSVDLETSVQQGLWATQVHNEQTLDQAYRTSKEVILIFGANKTGEFFGYAKMASGIGKSERRISWASRESGSGSVKSPISPTRSSFSTSSYLIVSHRGSALSERIVEDVEDQPGSGDDDDNTNSPAPEHIRAASASNPSQSSGGLKPDPPSSSSSLSLPLANQPETDELRSNGGGMFLFPEVRASPGEISPGEESKYSSLGSDLPTSSPSISTPTTTSTSTNSKPPTLLTKVLDRDGRGERVSAPAALERRAMTFPNLPRPLQGLTLDPADLNRLRVSDVSPSSPTSPLSASSNAANLQPPKASGVEDQDGVTRKDYSRGSLSSNSNSTRLSTSTGSGVSRASLVLPNLHLPPSPTSVALPGEGGTRRMFGTAPGEGGEGGGAEVWGTPFKVEWVRTTRLPFHRVRHLRNPWNQDREIKVSRDGTEVEPEIGRLLLAAWDTPISPPQFPTYLTSPPGTTYDPNQFNARPPPPPSLAVPPPANTPSPVNINNLTPPPPVLGLSTGLAPSFQQWGQYGMGR